MLKEVPEMEPQHEAIAEEVAQAVAADVSDDLLKVGCGHDMIAARYALTALDHRICDKVD